MFKKILLLAFTVALPLMGFAQKEVAYKKGTFFGFWGWNRSAYSNSDIRFQGEDYDFTLKDVVAHDRQSKISYHNYIQPDRITIPQTNFKLGYFFKDNMAISIGVDHMKYVMDQDQVVDFEGNIDRAGFENVGQDGTAKLTEDFLTFEHTDGLNYINAEFEIHHNFLKAGFFKLNGLAGIGAGALLPKSNVKLMNEERHDDFHLAGYGANVKVGVDLLFWNFFFLRCEGKQGYINMPNIRTTQSSVDKASQHFWFSELNGLFGVAWRF